MNIFDTLADLVANDDSIVSTADETETDCRLIYEDGSTDWAIKVRGKWKLAEFQPVDHATLTGMYDRWDG